MEQEMKTQAVIGSQTAGAKGDLYFLAFEKTKVKDSMSRRLAPTSGVGARPYMDVMTISSSAEPISRSEVGNMLGAHTKLLVEPVSVPKLTHTGVKTQLTDHLEEDVGSYFYPNGMKKLAFRDTIRQKLKEYVSDGMRLYIYALSKISVCVCVCV